MPAAVDDARRAMTDPVLDEIAADDSSWFDHFPPG